MKILFWTSVFYIIVVLHAMLIAANVLSVMIIPAMVPWYISVPLDSFLFNLFFNRAFKECPLTQLESAVRQKINMPPIKSYLGHYLYAPARRIYRRIKCLLMTKYKM